MISFSKPLFRSNLPTLPKISHEGTEEVLVTRDKNSTFIACKNEVVDNFECENSDCFGGFPIYDNFDSKRKKKIQNLIGISLDNCDRIKFDPDAVKWIKERVSKSFAKSSLKSKSLRCRPSSKVILDYFISTLQDSSKEKLQNIILDDSPVKSRSISDLEEEIKSNKREISSLEEKLVTWQAMVEEKKGEVEELKRMLQISHESK